MTLQDEIARLLAQEGLPDDYRLAIDSVTAPVAKSIAGCRAKKQSMLVVGLCGPQGSGKSTISAFLKLLLEHAGLPTVILSIDDLYLTHAERRQLGSEVHPLLATRGPPGTHDVALGIAVIEKLTYASRAAPVKLPRFDKSVDDRAPENQWPLVSAAPDILLFEGWCVGAQAQSSQALLPPINALERERDAAGVWRTYVNDSLNGAYRELFGKIDFQVFLRPPGFENVLTWRQLQEEKLRARNPNAPRLMTPEQIATFIMHYERVTRHILAEMPSRADIVIDIDDAHRLTGLHARAD